MKPGKRKLKVYRKFVPRAGYICHYVEMPEIRLCGVWLREAGFEIGKDVTVKHENGCIIITIN